jgi:hypothetical protein
LSKTVITKNIPIPHKSLKNLSCEMVSSKQRCFRQCFYKKEEHPAVLGGVFVYSAMLGVYIALLTPPTLTLCLTLFTTG